MARRRADWGSLVAAVLFLGLAVAFAVRGSGDWDFNAVWVLPVLAAGLGMAGVARALTRSRGSDERDGDAPGQGAAPR